MNHLLHRSDGNSFAVDTDLWLAALDLAAVFGWRPAGTLATDVEELAAEDPLVYDRPDGRRVVAEDAKQLAHFLERGLDAVPDEMVPLQADAFGEEHTLGLLRSASTGKVLGRDSCQAALEVLSGSPKSDARALVGFLNGGAIAITAARAQRN